MSYLHAVPKGFDLWKVAYVFKEVCLTGLFMNLESFVSIVLCFVLFIKNILVVWKMTCESVLCE